MAVRVVTLPKPASASPAVAASAGLISTNGSGDMSAQTRAGPGPRHRVPLVTHAAGIEAQRKGRAGPAAKPGSLRHGEAGAAVGREESSRAKKRGSPGARRREPATSPL